jgi:hypothetical protein
VSDHWLPKELLNAPIVFGLRAQGHIPTVERMLAVGASWDEIGKAIGWTADAAEQHYAWAKEDDAAREGV